MTALHVPSDETLLAYAAGKLGSGPALVVACHLAMRPESAARAGMFATLAGQVLETQPEIALSDDAFEHLMARVEADAEKRPVVTVSRTSPSPSSVLSEFDTPQPLNRYEVGRWRFLAPGLRFSNIDTGGDKASRPKLFKVKPGMVMPEHSHDGREYTLVLKGQFSDVTGTYGPGDFIEAGDELDHEPIAGGGEDCICLIAVDGRLKLKSRLARLVQPLIGF